MRLEQEDILTLAEVIKAMREAGFQVDMAQGKTWMDLIGMRSADRMSVVVAATRPASHPFKTVDESALDLNIHVNPLRLPGFPRMEPGLDGVKHALRLLTPSE